MIKKRFISMLVLLCLTVSGAWAQNPSWLNAGDVWDGATSTLTVNSNPASGYNKVDEIEHVIIADGVTTIGQQAFKNCSGLKSVSIPSSVTTIGLNAFAGCFNLTSVSIPGNEVNGTTIANDAFNGCRNLTTVTLGNGGGEINMYVFNGCKILTTVIVYAQSVDTWKVDDIFGDYNDEMKIYVPSNLVDAFEEADGWSDYSGMFEAITNVTGVTLAPTSATLTLGETETVTLTATVLPGDATDKSVTWTSSDEAVATVTDGVVTAVAAGEATITVTTTDGAKTATCAVTVAAPAASTYTVTLKEGTDDADNWTITPAEATTTGVAAGTEVKATYGGTKKVKSVKAVKKAKPAATVTTAPTAKTGVKAGEDVAIVNEGTAEGGTMMYMVNATQPASTDGFSATVPTAEGLTAGTYYVWYYVKADDSHTDSEISASGIEVTIAAATVLSGALVDGAIIKVNFKWRGDDSGHYVQGVYNAASGTFTASKSDCSWGSDGRAVYKVEKSGDNIIIGAGKRDYSSEAMVWTFNTTNDTYTTTNGRTVNDEPGNYGLISVTLNGTEITSQLTAQ